MSNLGRPAWYVFGVLAILVILFELFFRFRYERAGDRLWRIDRLTERACVVSVGDAICSAPPEQSSFPRARPHGHRNPYIDIPTPEPNPRH
jgi:hypothetical protein